MKPLVVVPCYDGKNDYGVTLRILDVVKSLPSADVSFLNSSFLTFNFNRLWCTALNDKSYTHFVMLHADVVPIQSDWLKRLIAIADKTYADVLSVVSAIKGDEGRTSTGLLCGQATRRLTMAEVFQLPETFGVADVASLFAWPVAESRLLTNTGCMCVRMFRRSILEMMCFDVVNNIRKGKDGEFYAVSQPEDWKWSLDAQFRGLKVMATRAIPLEHKGERGYRNDLVWGTLEHDREEGV